MVVCLTGGPAAIRHPLRRFVSYPYTYIYTPQVLLLLYISTMCKPHKARLSISDGVSFSDRCRVIIIRVLYTQGHEKKKKIHSIYHPQQHSKTIGHSKTFTSPCTGVLHVIYLYAVFSPHPIDPLPTINSRDKVVYTSTNVSHGYLCVYITYIYIHYITCVCVLTQLRQSPNKFDPTRLIRAELADTIKLDTPWVARPHIEILLGG